MKPIEESVREIYAGSEDHNRDVVSKTADLLSSGSAFICSIRKGDDVSVAINATAEESEVLLTWLIANLQEQGMGDLLVKAVIAAELMRQKK